jgi:hypothetical protein
MSEIGQAMAIGVAQSDSARPQASQDALDQALGIGPYLLKDEEMQKLISSMAFVKRVDEDGKPQIFVKPSYAALKIQASYTPRASKFKAIDAEIGMRRARMIFRRAKMKMTEAEYEAGGALVADAILNTIVIPNYLSAVDGFLVKMTKVSPRSMEVTYREDKSKNVRGFTP